MIQLGEKGLLILDIVSLIQPVLRKSSPPFAKEFIFRLLQKKPRDGQADFKVFVKELLKVDRPQFCRRL